MGIWLIIILWMLLAATFVLAICAAAARPIPAPGNDKLIEQLSMKSEIAIRSPRAIKACQAAALAVLLAVITSSCAAIPPGSHPINFGRSEPVKGATLLMDHSR